MGFMVEGHKITDPSNLENRCLWLVECKFSKPDLKRALWSPVKSSILEGVFLSFRLSFYPVSTQILEKRGGGPQDTIFVIFILRYRNSLGNRVAV